MTPSRLISEFSPINIYFLKQKYSSISRLRALTSPVFITCCAHPYQLALVYFTAGSAFPYACRCWATCRKLGTLVAIRATSGWQDKWLKGPERGAVKKTYIEIRPSKGNCRKCVALSERDETKRRRLMAYYCQIRTTSSQRARWRLSFETSLWKGNQIKMTRFRTFRTRLSATLSQDVARVNKHKDRSNTNPLRLLPVCKCEWPAAIKSIGYK